MSDPPPPVPRPRAENDYRPHGDDDYRVARMLIEYPPAGDRRFAVYRVPDHSRYSDLGRAIEGHVFEACVGDDPGTLAATYAAYEASTSCLLVIDRATQRVAGALRFLHDSSALKTLDDLRAPPWSLSAEHVQRAHDIAELERCWDILTVAVNRACLDGRDDTGIRSLLYAAVFSQAVRDGVTHFFARLGGHAREQLIDTLALPFVPLLAPPHPASPSRQACVLRLAAARPAAEAFLARHGASDQRAPRLLRLMIWGDGLPPVTRIE